MKVSVDFDVCASTGNCMQVCPEVFEVRSDGFLYVLQELTSKLEVWSFDSDKGTGSEMEIHSTLPEDFEGNNSTAEIYLHPNGKFLYCSNRGHNSIAIFQVDTETGKLSLAGHESTQGKVPRHFIIDPSGIAVTNNHVVTGAAAHEVYLDIVGRMRWFDTAPGVLERDGRDFRESMSIVR
jgi:ferredoxin